MNQNDTDVNVDSRKEPPKEPRPVDARRAVVDAAREDGTTCQRGAYRARRTITEPDPAGRPHLQRNVVRLECMSPGGGWDWVAHIRVVPIGDLRDDWKRPSPIDRGETALPEDEYPVGDLFVDGYSAVALPGMVAKPEGENDAE